MSSVAVVEHLKALVRIPSVSVLANRPVVEYAKAALTRARWQCREFTYRDASGVEKVNLVAAPEGQKIAERDVALAFICHTDTVPYAKDWLGATDPREADGHIYGCGACDVKGFLACLLAAIESIDPSSLPAGIRIILTADEEVGCVGAARLIADDVLRPRKLVVGEPTSLHPVRAGKGYALAEFTVHGREAHSALPANGVSAIYGAARLISAIEDYAATLISDANPIFTPAYTTVNVGTIQGGTAKNVIAGSCQFLLEWRPIANQEPARVFIDVKEIADRLTTSQPGFEYSARLLRQQIGFETRDSSNLVRAVSGLTGNAATSIAFGSEASVFAPMVEEVIVFGPGDMRTAHSDRECVPIAELLAAVECLKTLMTQPG